MTGAFGLQPATGQLQKGKREAGWNPARSRHCIKGVSAEYVTEEIREGCAEAVIFKSGNLPAMKSTPDHELLIVLQYMPQRYKIPKQVRNDSLCCNKFGMTVCAVTSSE